MKYCEIKAKYSDLDLIMEKVAGLLRGDAGELMAFGAAEAWINRTVAKEHRQAVADKFKKWIWVLKQCDEKGR